MGVGEGERWERGGCAGGREVGETSCLLEEVGETFCLLEEVGETSCLLEEVGTHSVFAPPRMTIFDVSPCVAPSPIGDAVREPHRLHPPRHRRSGGPKDRTPYIWVR